MTAADEALVAAAHDHGDRALRHMQAMHAWGTQHGITLTGVGTATRPYDRPAQACVDGLCGHGAPMPTLTQEKP